MLTLHHGNIEELAFEEAIAFTNQAFEFLIQEVLRVDVWNGNYLNHLNRYGLDDMLDELVNFVDLGGNYRGEFEKLMMISISQEYRHRIHPLILEYRDNIDYLLEGITYHSSKQFFIDEELNDDQTSINIANGIIENLKADIYIEHQNMVKLEKLLVHVITKR